MSPPPRFRLRRGFFGGLVLQIGHKVTETDSIWQWRDARFEDITNTAFIINGNKLA